MGDGTITKFESYHDTLRDGGIARRLETSRASNSIDAALPEDALDPFPQHARRLKSTVPLIIPQRADLLGQYAKVDAAWISFKEHILQIKDGFTSIEALVEMKSLMVA